MGIAAVGRGGSHLGQVEVHRDLLQHLPLPVGVVVAPLAHRTVVVPVGGRQDLGHSDNTQSEVIRAIWCSGSALYRNPR